MTVDRYIRILAGFFVMLSLALGVEAPELPPLESDEDP